MHDRNSTIDHFLTAAAAKQPTPGGGSVTALTGALAAALGGMVLSYSIGRKDLTQFTPELTRAAADLQAARESLLELMVLDQSAYEALTAARRRPIDDPDRPAAISTAVVDCIRVPMSIGRTAVGVLAVAERVVDKVNPWLLSDLAVSADLATATVRAAGYNVRANLPTVDSPIEQQRYRQESAELLTRAVEAVRRLSERIWQ